MLRRKPTTITLTTEDISAYDRFRSAASASASTAGGASGARSSASFAKDPNDELKPLPGDKARAARAGGASREERIVGTR